MTGKVRRPAFCLPSSKRACGRTPARHGAEHGSPRGDACTLLALARARMDS
jgi:hypothetical protein